jgi:hypothetical protein
MTSSGIPSDSRSTLTNEEWRINAQLRPGLPLANYHDQPRAPCPHGCKHPKRVFVGLEVVSLCSTTLDVSPMN